MRTLRCISLFIFLVGAVGLQAQGFIVEAGVNLNKLYSTAEMGNDNSKTAIGFQVGFLKAFGLTESVFLKTGLRGQMKGGKEEVSLDLGGQDYTSSVNVDIFCLEIPVLFGYKAAVGSGNIFVEAGPAVSGNLSARSRIKVTANGMTEKETDSIDIGSEEDELKFLEVSALGGVGYQWNSLSLAVRYQLGLTSLLNDSDDKLTNRALSVVLGYSFGK